MDKILDMMAFWNPLGQGVFLFLVLAVVVSAFLQLVKLGVILFRGWPPECQEEAEEV